MLLRQEIHELLELVLALLSVRGEQGLDELKSGKDVPFRRRAELHHQQYRGGQQSFGGIVEVGVLAEGGAVCAGQYDGLCDDFCLLLRLSLIAQPPLPQEGIYVAVHELEQVVAMRPGGIAQVDDRDAVPVALCHRAITSHKIALRVTCQKTHPRGAGIFQARYSH